MWDLDNELSTLQITDIQEEDAGNYIVEVNNSLGTAQTCISVSVDAVTHLNEPRSATEPPETEDNLEELKPLGDDINAHVIVESIDTLNHIANESACHNKIERLQESTDDSDSESDSEGQSAEEMIKPEILMPTQCLKVMSGDLIKLSCGVKG